MKCRCDVLNQLTGEVARDYARHHLDDVRVNGMRETTYRCPETGVTWVEVRAPASYGEDVRRLRRLDRA